jgi:hypothetical protein
VDAPYYTSAVVVVTAYQSSMLLGSPAVEVRSVSASAAAVAVGLGDHEWETVEEAGSVVLAPHAAVGGAAAVGWCLR